jgi:lysozyme family protein
MRPTDSYYFETAVIHTLELEGFFSNYSWDHKTKYGITEELAKYYGFKVEDLTIPDAKWIYRIEFWDTLRLEELSGYSHRVAIEVFDTAVNASPRRSILMLQDALNIIFKFELIRDGIIGRKTIGAVKSVISKRKENHLVNSLNGFQFSYYLHLLRMGHRAASKSIEGWMLRLETPKVENL